MGQNDVIAHNVRFYNAVPRAIHCMALGRKNHKLALSRSDNSIEIWDVKHMPHFQKVIFNDSTNSVEDIKWFKDRLFSCGLQGSIVEYDCYSECILYSRPVIGGPAWCFDINLKNNWLACGTEDGYIIIMEIISGGLEHYKFLDKQQGRILCISWEKSGQHLVTGSTDVIRVWNVEKGHAVHKMMTGRDQNKETIVWTLNVTSDFTIISGDSRGYLCFWDGKLGTQIEYFKSHEADIFSVTLKNDESEVYCSGVDPVIAIYGRILENKGGRRKWAKGGVRRIHDLDVRALALSPDGKLYSGGIDGYVVLSSFAPKLIVKFPPLLKKPCVKILTSKRYLMLRYLPYLEIWKLGHLEPLAGVGDSFLRLFENQTQLLQLKAREGDVIISSNISVNGQFVAYSTDSGIKFYKLSVEPDCSLMKLPDPPDCGPCRLIEFYEVGKRQFCAVVTKRNEIDIMEVGKSGPDVVHTIKPKENEILSDTISYLFLTSDGLFLIAADCTSNIAVWSMENWSYYHSLPQYQSAITAMAVNNKNSSIVVAYADFKIIEFSIKEKKYTEFSSCLGRKLANHLRSPVCNITFDSRKNSAIIVHDDTFICILYDDEDSYNESKIAKLNESDVPVHERRKKVSVIVKKKPEHLVNVDWLENDEMVIVTTCPLKLAEHYPAAFARKRFIK